ncbi:MAG TPA: serine hydrolase domain-containing protein [Cyclobacteriaceae bacterium]|nr:serine hydrolase domain-containing protein [Cyclobacteriaceae bacterium]
MKPFFLALCCLLLLNGPAYGQPADTMQLKAFMSGVVTTHLRDKHIAGATVSVIRDGKILLAQGYGYADVDKQIPVSASSTLFRIGSISKMFTWVSVMQLVAQGKLSLDEDINHYMEPDVQVPATFPKPITLKDLMTHTPGFEDKVLGLFARDSSKLRSLHDILLAEMPARIRATATFASYSNHGTGIAAYIIERVSGMSFNDYVEKNIIGPLGMTNTSFRQPLPAPLNTQLSTGYKFAGGEFKKQSFEYVPLYPVGAAASSATDMTKFMFALLHNGSWEGKSILDSATLALMVTPAHRHHPAVNPMRYGFMDVSQNGVNIIGHGGDTFWFHSLMVIFPETQTGLFISFNTDKGGGVVMDVLDQFVKQYYPEKAPLKPALAPDRKFLEQFAGYYRANRYAHFDITKVASMFGDTHITVADSTRLRISSGENVRYVVPIDSLTFREEHGSKVIAFGKNDEGKIANMFIGGLPVFAFDKVDGLEAADLHTMLFVISIVTTFLVLLYWPFVNWVRRGFRSLRDHLPLPIAARRVAWINYLLLLVFIVSLASLLSDAEDVVYGVGTSFKVVLVMPLMMIGLTSWMTFHAARLLPDNRYSFLGRIYYVLITLVSLASLWQLYHWNFLGFNY